MDNHHRSRRDGGPMFAGKQPHSSPIIDQFRRNLLPTGSVPWPLRSSIGDLRPRKSKI